MKMKEMIDPTLCNRYPNDDKEHIFAFKGRPFGCLTSPHLPTPTSTLMDYNLVKDLGMKMYDLQYQKFSYCGNKLRILGRVAITVQTIQDGFASGSFSIKASVVLDLNKSIDCECVAGAKLTSKLLRGADPSIISTTPTSSRCSSPSSSSQSPSASPSAQSPSARPPAASPPSPQARTSAQSPRPPGITSPSPPSPPGFPVQPQYWHLYHRHPELFKIKKRPEIKVSLVSLPDPNPSILTANHYALSTAFNDADIQPTSNQELRTLLEIDPKGKVEPGTKNATTFKTSHGFVYEFGHGRNRCMPDQCMLKTQEEMPNNCGFHNQFYRPYNFQVCGPSCSGALCSCLQFY